MGVRIAIVTSQIEPSQTFLFRDFDRLKKNGFVSLYSLIPSKEPKSLPKDLEVHHCFSHSSFLFSLAFLFLRNVKMVVKRPDKYFYAFANIFAIHLMRPIDLLIMLMLFPVMSASASIMKEEGIELIHGYWAGFAATFAMTTSILLSVPYSVSIHAKDLLEEKKALKKKMNGAVQIIACSEFAIKRLRSSLIEIEPNKIMLCRHGLDLEQFRFHPLSLKRSIEIKKILTAGRIVPKKGFVTLVKALDLIAQQGQKIECLIYGPVRHKKYWRELKKAMKNSHENLSINLNGWISSIELMHKLNGCDLYIQASEIDFRTGDQDGIPNILLEAMALGTPVIATNVGGIPEVIRNNYNGLMVPSGSPGDLAEAILHFFSDPKAAAVRSRRARSLIEEKFDIKKTGEDLARILFCAGMKNKKI